MNDKFAKGHADKEIKAALRGEAILVQAKRIPKNFNRSNLTFNQDRSQNVIETFSDQQVSLPTVAHRIKIIKQHSDSYDDSHSQDSSYIDKLFETNAYKRRIQTFGRDYAQGRRNDYANLEKSRIFENKLRQRPKNKCQGSDTSFPRGPVKNYKGRSYSSTTVEENDLSNSTKKKKPHKMQMYEKRKLRTQVKIRKSGHNLDVYPSHSQNMFLQDQKSKYAKRKANVPFSAQNITKKASNRNDHLHPIPMKRGLNNLLSKQRTEDVPVREVKTIHPKRKRIMKQKERQKEVNLRATRIKNELVYSQSSSESGHILFGPPPSKVPSRAKFFPTTKNTDENYKAVYSGPSLFEKMRNWVNAKILEAKIKKLIIFREKHKLTLLSESETEMVKHGVRLQKGDEWLAYTGSDTSFDQDFVEKAENQRIKFKYPEESYHLHSSLNPYFKSLRAFGRLPFVIVKENQEIQVKMSRQSCNFILFCITTILLTIIGAIIAVEFVDMYNSQDSQEVNQKADHLIFNTYWVFGLISLLNILYILLWSYSVIFQSGLYLEEYLTRWHLALAMIKYSPEALAARFVTRSQVFLALYCILSTLLFVFGKQYWPLFWENGGLMAMLLFRRFIDNPMLHEYFLYMRIFGHLIYLYCIYCSRMITVLVLVHCKLMETIARRWNLRLGCILEKVAIVQPGVNAYTMKTRVIPYTKLFAEHLIVTTFARHTGKVFSVAGISYYTFKGITMFTSLYILAQYFLADFTGYKKDNKGTPETIATEKGHETTFTTSRDLKILTDIFIMAQCWIGFLVTSEGISKVGSVIMSGYDFIRRHGMISCVSSYERRFILSMQFAFSPVYDYHINFGFKVDRTFIFKFASVIFGFCVLVSFFSHFRWQIENIKQCKNETCIYSFLPRLFSRHIIVNGS